MGAQAPPGLSDEKAARMMAALRAGQTLRLFGVKAPRLEAYFAAHPYFAREAKPLMEANAKAARLRKGAHIRNKTHCINGHPFAVHGRVAVHKGWLTRQCRACETMRARRGDVIKPMVLAVVKAALKKGLTIGAITKSGRPTRLVKHNALARRRREDPEFDRFVSELTKDNHSRGQLLRRQRARNAAVREETNDYYRIRAMLPASFPDRDDVVSDIFEALLNGSLRRDQVKGRVREYIAIHNRAFSTQYPKFGGRRLHSLDAPAFADGLTTVGDGIAFGLWD